MASIVCTPFWGGEMQEPVYKKPIYDLIGRSLGDPLTPIAITLLAIAFYIFTNPGLQSPIYALALVIIAVILVAGRYLGVFDRSSRSEMSLSRAELRLQRDELKQQADTIRDIRNFLMHARAESSPEGPINIDDEFKSQLLARLTTESQNALRSFIESEVFKKVTDADQKAQQRGLLSEEIRATLERYQIEMMSWRKNANINLIIGLVCALVGIGVMWQTLVTLSFEAEAAGSWKVSDLYRFLARFGLVLIIESVAFFFLKLYREDRSMIRYLRNEITNLEARYLALITALSFGSAADLSKMLQSLAATERNFLLKKGDRVISDITYENSEIMVEKIANRISEIAGKVKPGTS
jgi:hypothetical protein